MTKRFPKRRATDDIFRLTDGSTTKEIGRTFNAALKELGLDESPQGKRTLYCLRHSLITWDQKTKADIAALAKQCGTNIDMSDRTYSDLLPSMFRQEFSGVIISIKSRIHLSDER